MEDPKRDDIDYDKKHTATLVHAAGQDGVPVNAAAEAADAQAQVQLAMEKDKGLPWISVRGAHMALIVFLSCCCSGDNGFDSTVMGAVNSMTQYQQYFGMRSAGAATGIVFGIYTVGTLCSFIPAAYIPDRFGRRACMFFGNACLITGSFITANAKDRPMFLGGRFLTGFGCGTASTGAKSYLVELAPPHTRGRLLGFLNSFYYVGQILASGLTIPTGKMDSDLSWRLPMYIQAIPAFINFALIWFMPESPRWLYSRGHTDQAARVLARYHSEDDDVNSPLIKVELEEIETFISLQGSDKRWWDVRPLVRKRSDRWRSACVLIISFWGQFSGNGLVTYFLPVLLEQAGITSPDRQRVLNFVNSITSMIGALVGTAIIDHFGRRKLLLSGSVVNAINMCIITGLLSDPDGGNYDRAQAGIAFIFWFMVCFSFGWTAMQAVYPSEVLSFQSRAKGLALSSVFVQGVSCINTFAMPVALDDIEWKSMYNVRSLSIERLRIKPKVIPLAYIIFVVIDVIGFFVIWFVCPETKELTLEELDKIFDAHNPVKYSLESLKVVKEARREGVNAP